MKDSVELVIFAIVVAASFALGGIIGMSRIQRDCDKLSSFYIDSKVYECKLK
jgi:hypothetical protein